MAIDRYIAIGGDLEDIERGEIHAGEELQRESDDPRCGRAHHDILRISRPLDMNIGGFETEDDDGDRGTERQNIPGRRQMPAGIGVGDKETAAEMGDGSLCRCGTSTEREEHDGEKSGDDRAEEERLMSDVVSLAHGQPVDEEYGHDRAPDIKSISCLSMSAC
jgi:hypothetical protein